MTGFGRFQIAVRSHGFYKLDGGAMFGNVPKPIWNRLIPADADNRIRLATQSLLVRDGERLFLVDAGNGERGSEKHRRIFGIEPAAEGPAGIDPAAVTDVLISHLHFDHSGGLAAAGPDGPGGPPLRFPGARIHVQKANLENARHPNPREKASYLAETTALLERSDLVLTEGSREIAPGIWVHRADGHTRGLQWVEVRDGARTLAFPSDMIPTSRHLPLPYAMGYDICVERLMEEKEALLRKAVENDWILVFVHDPDVPAATIKIDERGHFAVREPVAL
ncbi:MAG: MBL fold metallo-hydrolase [Candidatus Aminicenantales bacterium]|jgi:glyoxylase-like metal-dependent hydrolase (beta-lactamase superfamily II)